jgi:hypothetical protein
MDRFALYELGMKLSIEQLERAFDCSGQILWLALTNEPEPRNTEVVKMHILRRLRHNSSRG